MQLEYLKYLTKITPVVTRDALAESLYIIYSALSKALTVLEKEFDCLLSTRTRRACINQLRQKRSSPTPKRILNRLIFTAKFIQSRQGSSSCRCIEHTSLSRKARVR